jgi:hypothetical protein
MTLEQLNASTVRANAEIKALREKLNADALAALIAANAKKGGAA